MQKRGWVIWVAAFVVWMLIGLSFSINDYVFKDMLADYYKGHLSLPSMLSWDLVYWPTWVLFAPLIFLIARRYPLGRGNWHPNLLINLIAGLLIIILHRAIYLSIVLVIVNQSERYLLFYNLPMGFMSYVVLLLASHLINYARNQEEEARTSRLEADLTQAQLQVLEPYTDSRFQDAVEKEKDRLQTEHDDETNVRIFALLEELKNNASYLEKIINNSRYLERLPIKINDRVFLIKVADIDWIEAQNKEVCLHVGEKTYLHREAISSLESRLDPTQFLRIHRSHIVNVDRIQKLEAGFHNEYQVVLRDGKTLMMSRSQRKRLCEMLGWDL